MGNKRHSVVIVGGGFGGLACVQALRGAAVDITLIDRRNHHLFQPLLYQVATAALSPSEVAWPIRHMLRNRPEVRTLLGAVAGVDLSSKNVVLDHGERVPYDSLVIATGARHSYFGNDDWEKFAPGLKTLDDATAIRGKLLAAFETAERTDDLELRKALLTFVIVGAGPTGVELAGAIVDLARTSLTGEFRSIAASDARVVLIEAGPAVLRNFVPALSDYARDALARLGVEVILNAAVTRIDASGIEYGSNRLPTNTIFWAAGVQASPAARWLGLNPDRAGRVLVLSDLTIPNHPEIFVIGDTASLLQPSGTPVPGIADAAKQGGKHAARTIMARLAGNHKVRPFQYKHAGDLATIGKKAAVIDFGWIRLKGGLAWWAWGVAHIYFLIDNRNRIAVALSWLWIHLSGWRSARLITRDEDDAL